MKKVLSIILTAAMLLALFTIIPATTAGAAPEDTLVWRYALTPDEDAVISAPDFDENSGHISVLNIPSFIDGHKVVSIGYNAFKDFMGADQIVIPDSVKKIGPNAFEGCYATAVVIPDSVTEINEYAFANSRLTSVNLPKNLTTVSTWAFFNSGITSVTFPSSVTEIKEYAFANCRLTSVTFPSSVKTIGRYAFCCSYLNAVTIPKTVTLIGERAFGYHSWEPDEVSDTTVESAIPFTISGYGGSAAETYAKKNSITFQQIFDIPSINRFERVTNGNRIIINKVNGCQRYRIFYNVGKGWVKAGDTTTTTFTHKNLKSGTKYLYTVRCMSKDGKKYLSDFDRTGWAITFVAAPNPPKLTNISAGIQVKWGKSKGAAKYRIFRKTGNGKWVAIAATNKLSYVDKNVKKGYTYRYTIRCMNANNKYVSAYNNGSVIKRVK